MALSDIERARQAKTAHQQPTSGMTGLWTEKDEQAVKKHNQAVCQRLKIAYVNLLDDIGRSPADSLDLYRLTSTLGGMVEIMQTQIRLLNIEHSKRVHD